MTYVQVEFLEGGRPVYAKAQALRVLTAGTLKAGLEVTLSGYQGNFSYRVTEYRDLPSCDSVWICTTEESKRQGFRLNFRSDYGWELSEISICAVATPR